MTISEERERERQKQTNGQTETKRGVGNKPPETCEIYLAFINIVTTFIIFI